MEKARWRRAASGGKTGAGAGAAVPVDAAGWLLIKATSTKRTAMTPIAYLRLRSSGGLCVC
jgi:hypothetical protein